MKIKEKFAVCRMVIVMLFTVVLVLLPGCGKEEEAPSVTVTFNLGYDNAQGTPAPVKITKNGTLGKNLPQTPIRNDGYTFIGWFSNGVEYTAQAPAIADDITLTAEWAKNAPDEASLFNNLTLATPYKGYNDGNPLMTQEFGADPNVLVKDGRVYVYMTADSFIYGNDGKVVDMAQNYGHILSFRVLSSADLVNWTQHSDIEKSKITSGSWIQNLWAPAPVVKEVNGREKIFLYFSNNTNTAVISADNPLGPWTSPRSNALLSSSTPNTNGVGHIFDPGVLIDDDGRAYIYFGGATPSGGSADNYDSNHPRPKNMRVVELGADMISIIGTPVLLDIPFTFEASEINKIKGKYYYSYSSNPQVTRYKTMPDNKTNPSGWTAAQIRAYAEKNGESLSIGYAISDKPLPNNDGTGFELTGMVMPNPGTMFNMGSNNNHHKIFEFMGRWYIVYHTHLLSDAMFPSKDWNYRSTSIDSVTINSDGTIKVVEGTRTGVKQISFFDPYQITDAATMAVMAGISTTPVSGALRMKVTGIDSGDWIALRGVDFKTGTKKFNCRVTPPASGKGVIQIKQDGLDGPAIGYVIVEPEQTEITVDLLRNVYGIHDLVFVFYGQGYDFEQWKFIK